MDVQVFVFQIERELHALSLHGAEQRLADIQVHGVAELVQLGRAGGLDAGGQVARVVRAEAGMSQRPEQVFQGFETQKVDALVGDLHVYSGFLLAGPA